MSLTSYRAAPPRVTAAVTSDVAHIAKCLGRRNPLDDIFLSWPPRDRGTRGSA